MLKNDIFYHSITRKMVVLMGTLLNEVFLDRYDSNGKLVAAIKVPVTYAPKDKMLSRVFGDPTLDRPVSVETLPAISFELKGIYYDKDRSKIATHEITVPGSSGDLLKSQFVDVPYNFAFNAYVYAKNAEDGTKIIEQILPFFTPSFVPSVNLINETVLDVKIPVILTQCTVSDNFNGTMMDRRQIIWELEFIMKGFLYGPIREFPVIKYANTGIFMVNNNDTIANAINQEAQPVVTYLVQPGLTANGQPTSNASNSIPVSDITATDDFGFVIFEEDFVPTSNS